MEQEVSFPGKVGPAMPSGLASPKLRKGKAILEKLHIPGMITGLVFQTFFVIPKGSFSGGKREI